MNTYPKVSVKKGREYQLLRGHPWLFSGGISQAPNKVAPGSIVDLVDTNGRFIARGYYNPQTDIAVRVLSRDADRPIDRDFLKERLRDAYQLRQSIFDPEQTDAYRLVHAEGDFLPGFVVDYFAGILVVQSHTAGADALLSDFIEALAELVNPSAIVLRNDAGGRKREGLEVAAPQVVRGEIPAELVVRENGLKFVVDPLKGQKTGFFTDQRDKRKELQTYAASVADGGRLLNVFSYTAGFAVYAAARNPGLATINIDESQRALEQAQRNFELNGLSTARHQFQAAEAFSWLEQQAQAGEQFDIAVLDPPAFAKSHKDKVKALKAYYRMDRLGIAVTNHGGTLVVCSCSGSITMDEFTSALRDAATDSGRELQILQSFQNGPDHPIAASAPEGNYLKVLFCRVL